jgi:hypothetical protein
MKTYSRERKKKRCTTQVFYSHAIYSTTETVLEYWIRKWFILHDPV